MIRFGDTSIKIKLRFIIITTILLALLMVFSGFLIYETMRFKESLTGELQVLAEIIGDRSKAAITFGDYSSALENLAALKAKKSIDAAALYFAQGDVFVKYSSAGFPDGFVPPDARENISFFQGAGLHVFREIFLDDEKIGTVYLRSNLREINERFKNYAVMAAIFVFGSLLAAYMLSLRLQRFIFEPIVHLADKLKAVAENKDFSIRAQKKYQDELGTLIDGFNEMLSQIQRRDESILKQKEEYERLAVAVEQSHENIMIIDTEGAIIYVNPALEKQMGFSHEELLKMNMKFISRTEEQQSLFREAWESIKQGNMWTGHMSPRGKDGSIQELDVIISPIRNTSGKITSFVSIAHNVTKELELEDRLRRSEKMEAIGTLAGGVAHDLNNILGAIVGYPDLLLDDIPEGSPMRKSILAIKQSGERAASIVQDLLTLARRGVRVTEVVNLNTLTTKTLETREYAKLKEFNPDIETELNLGKDLLNIIGSPVHLSKTIMNLVSNAAESMPGGGKIKISTENRYLDKTVLGSGPVREGDYVALTLEDCGVGIAADDLDKIFEPFYTKKVMGRSGTGLGMAVVWGTVKDHNGYIDTKSTLGRGTTFTLYFPATRKEATGDGKPLSIEEYLGQGEKILVVDDISEQREIAEHFLKRLNYRVVTASSGEEAVEHLKNEPADLLILDMIMDPGIDGLETYKRILERNPNQQAIIASGFSETDRIREAQRLGAGAYIRKPYTLDKLGLVVKSELAKNRS